jgi:hypothetical protein
VADSELLNSISIASPCSASWEAMSGHGRVRFCDQCHKNVYNLSDMSLQEATDLIVAAEGKLCVRFYRRADGTTLTRDCQGGMAALRWRLGIVVATVGGLALLLLSLVLSANGRARGRAGNSPWSGMEPFNTVANWLLPTPTVSVGEVCPPPATTGAGPLPAGVAQPMCPDDM